MKLAFSNATMPELGLDDLLDKSAAWGYDGVELATLHGQADLGLVATLRADAAAVREKLGSSNQTIAAIHAGLFVAHESTACEGSKSRARLAIESAAEIGCGLVLMSGSPAPAGYNHQTLLHKYADALIEVTDVAASLGVQLAIENAGALSRTHDLWFVCDAVGSPALRVCMDPLRAAAAGDSPSIVLNRLSRALALVGFSHEDYAPADQGGGFVPSSGTISPQFLIEVLKGFAYRGWLSVRMAAAITKAENSFGYFEAAAKAIRADITRERVILTAYKGDKNAPRFAAAAGSA